MTWKEFKQIIDDKIKEDNKTEDVEINFIDFDSERNPPTIWTDDNYLTIM